MIIYGAGTLGIQLLRALNETGGYKMVAFIDPNPSLAGQLVHGVKVLRPEKIGKVITDENVKEVLLATPSALRGERRLALKVLEAFPVVVKTLPALEEIASGHVQVSDLRPIDVEDLLGRDPVTPNLELLAANVQGKVVMITGAGGSIGSELTRQLLKLGPKTLVLFELSEVALYDISMEIDDLQRRLQKEAEAATAPTAVVAVLGSVLDRKLVTRTIQERGVEVIYHAAAYKHVPIVEANPFAGLQNNTFGTLVVAEAAKELRGRAFRAGVERQGGAPDQHHGREQAPRRADSSGARARSAAPAPSSPWSASATCSIRRARWSSCSATRSRPAARSRSPIPT